MAEIFDSSWRPSRCWINGLWLGPLTLAMRMTREVEVHSIPCAIVELREGEIWITCWADAGEVIVTIYEFNELHLDSWGEIKRGVCVGGGHLICKRYMAWRRDKQWHRRAWHEHGEVDMANSMFNLNWTHIFEWCMVEPWTSEPAPKGHVL